jgi:hypothetical protein
MNKVDHITKFFHRNIATVPTFGHLVMLSCAIASYENIHDFFKVLHGSDVVAVGLGIAVGAALVLSAALLAGMGGDWRNPRLQLIATVTTLLALLSGGIQGASYAAHGLWWLWAGLIGLALPVVGELGIALAVSAYEQEQKAKRLAAADDQVEERINGAVDLALSDIDMSSTKKDIEAAARKIVKNKLDTLLARRIGAPMPPSGNDETAESNHVANWGAAKLPEANAARQQAQAERQRSIVELLTTCGALTTSEIVARLADDFAVTTSERTVRADLSTLADAGQVGKSGRQWWAQAMIAELPEPAVIHTNGKAH